MKNEERKIRDDFRNAETCEARPCPGSNHQHWISKRLKKKMKSDISNEKIVCCLHGLSFLSISLPPSLLSNFCQKEDGTIKEAASKTASYWGGTKNSKKSAAWVQMTYFFPLKIQIWPYLMVEISDGNTLLISNPRPLKSKKMVQHRHKISSFRPQICCRHKFLTGPKFHFWKIWLFSFILHFESKS